MEKSEGNGSQAALAYLGPIIVIISFFLPWIGSSSETLGFKFIQYSFRMFEMAEYKSEFILVGIYILLFFLSPIVCHIIMAIKFYNKKYISKNLATTPLIIWIILIIIDFILSAVEYDFDPIRIGPNFGIGMILTFIGMIFTIIVVLSNMVPNNAEAVISNSNNIKFCPKCGASLKGDETFCSECGAHLKE